MDFSGSGVEVALVAFPERTEMGMQARLQGTRKWDDAVFAAFSFVDSDGSLSEIEVLDAVDGLAQEGQCFESLPLGGRGNPAFQRQEFQGSAGGSGIEAIQIRFPEAP